MGSARTYRIGLAVTGLALLAWLIWHNLSGEFRPLVEASGGEAQRIDAARSWQYDEAGQLAYRLDSPQVVDREGRDRYRLDSPVARIIDTDRDTPPWQVSANIGWIERTGGTVDLEGDVLAQRAPHEMTGRLEMRTEAMQVRPNDRRAQSSAPATLLERQADGEPRWTSDSERLTLDWGGERLTQTGTVRDVYRTGDAP